MSTSRDLAQIGRANASSRLPVVLVHGLWMLPSSWDRWAAALEDAGYAPVVLSWPDDPDSVGSAQADPDVFAGKTVGQVADHLSELLEDLDTRPAVIGHSFGGLLTQILAGRGQCAVSVAIAPAPFRGVLPLTPSSLRAAKPVLGNPVNRIRAVPLTFDEFRYAFANAVPEAEASQLYADHAVPASGAPLFETVTASLNPWTEVKADSLNPDRGPMLIVYGEKDRTVPRAVAASSCRRQKRNPGTTEITEMPGRGHSLVIDHGWREVADTATAFVERFAGAGDARTGTTRRAGGGR